MRRRRVLRTAPLLATAATVGLAGCGGGGNGSSGGSGPCENPSEPETALPEPEGYEPGYSGYGSGSGQFEVENAERFAVASYTGPDDGTYVFIALEFTDASAAEAATGNSGEFTQRSTVSYVVSGRFLYTVSGPDSDGITDLIRASSVTSGCADAFTSP